MPNLLPLLALAGAAVVLGKKKKKKKTVTEPEPPDELPLPDVGEREGPGEFLPDPEDPSFQTSEHEPPQVGKPVANGVERHFTGAYAWKILFTEQGDYAAHYYPMGTMGPHEEVARGDTIDKAIEAFKFWATNEDRRKRNLPPLLVVKAVQSTAKKATFDPADQGDAGGDGLGS